MQIQTHNTPRGPVRGVEIDVRSMTEWSPVVTQVRDAVLRGWVVGSNMLEEVFDLPEGLRDLQPTQRDVDHIADFCDEAVRAGRLIDFGAWSNDVIKYGGKRGGQLYDKGAIGHPFSQPYMFMHTWEGATAVYLVNPLEQDKLAGGDCEAVELNPLIFGESDKALMIADRILLEPTGQAPTQYRCQSIPSVWRFLPGAEVLNGEEGAASAAAGNVLDPVMTALLILSTRNIARETVAVSDKLAKARMKAGKPPIPPYDRVFSAPYVTAIEARRARGRSVEPKGGTHASPVAHIRMGHPRTLADGRTTFVRDALVNMSEEAKKMWMSGRSHYVVKP